MSFHFAGGMKVQEFVLELLPQGDLDLERLNLPGVWLRGKWPGRPEVMTPVRVGSE